MLKKILIAATMLASATAANAMDSSVIERIQNEVNTTIEYKIDRGGKDIWKIPTRFGDCEDFALLKRQMLLAAGFDEDDINILLLIKQSDSGNKKIMIGHVVLYIRSQNLILDMPKNASATTLMGKYSSGKDMLPYEEYMKISGFSLHCKIADISSNEYPTVSQRCEKKKKS